MIELCRALRQGFFYEQAAAVCNFFRHPSSFSVKAKVKRVNSGVDHGPYKTLLPRNRKGRRPIFLKEDPIKGLQLFRAYRLFGNKKHPHLS